jgi:hypothetical protein
MSEVILAELRGRLESDAAAGEGYAVYAAGVRAERLREALATAAVLAPCVSQARAAAPDPVNAADFDYRRLGSPLEATALELAGGQTRRLSFSLPEPVPEPPRTEGGERPASPVPVAGAQPPHSVLALAAALAARGGSLTRSTCAFTLPSSEGEAPSPSAPVPLPGTLTIAGRAFPTGVGAGGRPKVPPSDMGALRAGKAGAAWAVLGAPPAAGGLGSGGVKGGTASVDLVVLQGGTDLTLVAALQGRSVLLLAGLGAATTGADPQVSGAAVTGEEKGGPAKRPLPVGTRVIARWKGGKKAFPGAITSTAVEGGRVVHGVLYDDGDAEAGVEERHVRAAGPIIVPASAEPPARLAVEEQAPPAPPAPTFAPSARVLVSSPSGAWRAARITRVDAAEGYYFIRYDGLGGVRETVPVHRVKAWEGSTHEAAPVEADEEGKVSEEEGRLPEPAPHTSAAPEGKEEEGKEEGPRSVSWHALIPP